MKLYKTFNTAVKNNKNKGKPIIKVGKAFVVFEDGDGSVDLTEIAVIRGGSYTGNVNVRHLERLGNANWAEKGSPGSVRTL